jgi:hypothetical protein
MVPPGSGTTPGLLMSNENVYVSPAVGSGAAAPEIFNLRPVGSGFAMVKVVPWIGISFKV